MNYRSVGRSGLKVSALGLGGWLTFGRMVQDPKIARKIIGKAYESGINFFDIADVYARGEAEKAMGRVLGEFPRHTLVISTKLYWPMSDDINDRGLSRKHIMDSIDKSLARIGTDYVDMYFCHRPDPETPLEETARAMDDLIHRGKVLYWGTSEWPADLIQKAVEFCEKHNLYKPQVEQPEYNLLARRRFEKEIMPRAQKLGMGLVTWSPLASGMLSGKYDGGVSKGTRFAEIESLKKNIYSDAYVEKVRRFKTVAEGLGATRSQLALAWCLRQPAISSVITGATKPEQLEDNLKAAELALTADALKQIDIIFGPELQHPRGD